MVVVSLNSLNETASSASDLPAQRVGICKSCFFVFDRIQGVLLGPRRHCSDSYYATGGDPSSRSDLELASVLVTAIFLTNCR